MTIKELLIEADAIQVGVVESDWQRVIKLAARPLEAKGFISTEYSQAVIDNTLNHGAYYVFDEGIAIPMPALNAASDATALAWWCWKSLFPLRTVKKADIVIMFGARDSNAHIEEGIRSIVALLDNNDTMAKLRTARSREEVVALL